ncbi:RagB/SusD family nutrient uptake outer membrane protein [Natronoflexus pectinivorans]|uniref:Putative outer membrane starch-binding protein n=1 Tax=Natronoflexus pectinivorans TaxID=682526 RepID=A0A4R2GJU1_9BACT|nr:RagB/SusD family nutrient uptake outer membrane protein [Natronoflexus pectinivorans]TCO08837.1 putative outer membrane starch-binding protein [Natronoflexus pectinivorans]
MKKIVFGILFFSLMFGACSDFLEEEMVGTLTQEHFSTEQGIEDLINGAYEGFRFHFAFEWSYSLTNYGTDEFTHGGGMDRAYFNNYDGALNPGEWRDLQPFWDNMFAHINQANTGIARIPEVLAGKSQHNTRLGEAYFIRGFNYLKLVEQFGGVPIKLNPTSSIELEFRRASAGEVIERVITDLRMAEQLLPNEPAQKGRAAKSAARHFLAKAYLFRASERNAEFTRSTDLDSAAFYAEQVINDPRHQLAPDFHDIFNYTTVNGPNEHLPEIIFAAQFDDNQSLLGRYGNRVHLYFPSVYFTLPGMMRDLANGREFQRLRPTNFALDVFDRSVDSRFYKSFKTAYFSNNANTLPRWTEDNAPSPELVGEPRFQVGDTSIIYIVNSLDDDRFVRADIDNAAPHIYIRNYINDEGQNATNYTLSQYPALSKYFDHNRQTPNDERGTRDGILARLAETYLIAAEAYGRKGDYAKALEFVNAIRERAAYKEGEERKIEYYISENIPFGETGSTVEDMRATVNAFTPGTPEADQEMYPAGVTSQEQMFVHFILNERARELMGELIRWVDLSRTNTLITRATAFNAQAAPNIRERHVLRPIPQSHLDAIQWDGRPLTADEKQAEQNPGY